MSKMVNKLCLKQTIIRRFVNEIDDSDQDISDDDVKIIESKTNTDSNKDCQQLNVCLESKTKTNGLNKRFTNLKILMRSCGDREERVVDINSDLNPLANPFECNTGLEGLDQLIGCQDLKEFENILLKANKRLETVVKTKKSKKKKKQKTENGINGTNNVEKSDKCEFKANDIILEGEGIRKIKSKSKQTFKCFVCDLSFNGIQNALNHIQSDNHLKKKFGDDLKGVDAFFTIDSEMIGDVEIAIARKSELKKISSEDKQLYLEHGIRLKNGFGFDAYICSTCNLSFESLSEVCQHIQSLEKVVEQSSVEESEEAIDNSEPNTSISKLDLKFKNEGINSTESSDDYKYYCFFCNIYFDCKKTVVSHMNDPRHQKTKRGENMNETDHKFTLPSERIHEFEIAFARKNVLKKLSPKTKIQFTNEFICLKDGIGLNAFVCKKCNESIESVKDIESHIKSFNHLIMQ